MNAEPELATGGVVSAEAAEQLAQHMAARPCTITIGDVEVSHGVVLRPGDTLLLAVSETTDPETLQHCRDQLLDLLGEDIKVVLVAGVEQLAVYRPELD